MYVLLLTLIIAAFLTQKCTVDDRTVKFEIWDTAGQERFHSLAPMYYRNAQAAIVMYDITKAVNIFKLLFIKAIAYTLSYIEYSG